jgi:vacuolar-type H+-ATPase subunit F/Vma7
MTPQEKAKQLFESFEDDLMESDVYFLEAAKKRCALITVNELIKNEYQSVDKLLNIIQDNKIKLVVSLPDKSYWESVKNEIEKIEIEKL